MFGIKRREFVTLLGAVRRAWRLGGTRSKIRATKAHVDGIDHSGRQEFLCRLRGRIQ